MLPHRLRRLSGSLLLLCAALAGPVRASAQDRGVGLGMILGEPTGVSGKAWTSRQNALDFGLSWAFGKSGYVTLHADYLWHFDGVIRGEERIVLYTGVGGRFGLPGEKGLLGMRIPFGAAFWLREVPLDIFLEVAPILDLIPATGLSGNAGLGARYFF